MIRSLLLGREIGPEALGEQVRQLRRKDRGWSFEELAHRTRRHWTYIGVERDERNPTIRVVGDIAKTLGVSICGLFPDG